MLRFLTAGESHGPAEVAILEGMPAGLPLSASNIQTELDKRRGGAGRGGRGKIEGDQVKILSGVRLGKTIGSPIALLIENQDFKNWQGKQAKVTIPRPGHADLAGAVKYGFDDIRNVIERASARETVMRVAVGAICKQLLNIFDIEIASHTIQIGQIKLNNKNPQFDRIKNVFSNDPEIRCIDPEISRKMKEAILNATKHKNTLGGIIEIVVRNVPAGLGSYVHFDRKLDGQLAQVIMSIPSVKAIEIGEGITSASKFGSEVHDAIFFDGRKFVRKTNRAGGIEGGVTNGEDIIIRTYHKPISTLGNPLPSVDIVDKQPTKAHIERSDICVVPRAGIISESMVAFIVANAFLEKYGGDTLGEIKKHFI